MSETRPSAAWHRLLRLAHWAALAVLALILGAQLVFFVAHAAHLLGYPYPLDYGEGPLLAQVHQLRAGTPIWRLYANPDQPPYAVVNYPPVYPWLVALVALPIGDALLAGRLVSLVATLAVLAALWLLVRAPEAGPGPIGRGPVARVRGGLLVAASQGLIVLALLGIPIVREWAVAMRVDMLGVCLGLSALVIVRHHQGRRALLWAALPLALSLLTKPSLVAAPAAALVWLLFRDWRRAIQLGVLTGAIGGAVAGLMQLGSGGWFLLHVLSANANPWQRGLAYGFWHDQLAILWPLVGAGMLGGLFGLLERAPRTRHLEPATRNLELGTRPTIFLPIYYTLFGAVVAYGVGKVGAYANYFLELYAGLIWLAAIATRLRGYRLVGLAVLVLVAGAQLRYYPTWSETYLKLAGIIEGHNPPRLVLGRYGVWQDLQRERAILAAYAGINAALNDQVRAAGAPIFTDVPGVAAQAGQLARLQAFEYRQLLDAGLADQRGLLRDLANGRVPLVVLDYLGNWLTPEMITLVTHRYAQDGSRGTYDLYRPVAPGPVRPADLAFPTGLRLVGWHLAPSPGQPAYHPGETVVLTLDWRVDGGAAPPAGYDVAVQLTDSAGRVLLEFSRPLLYGALAPRDWGGSVVQHMQPLSLPPELLPMAYQLTLALRLNGRDLAAPQPLTALAVAEPAGRQLGERGYYVPAPLLAAWRELGGDESAGPGDALMPAVPFGDGTLQCFARACLRLSDGQWQRVPLGELVHLADAGLRPAGAGAPGTIGDGFRAFWEAHGGAQVLGPAVTAELVRGDRIVQYTRYARLERPLEGSAVRLGRLGDEYLRLPGGGPYRWPEYGAPQSGGQ